MVPFSSATENPDDLGGPGGPALRVGAVAQVDIKDTRAGPRNGARIRTKSLQTSQKADRCGESSADLARRLSLALPPASGWLANQHPFAGRALSEVRQPRTAAG